MRFCAVLCDIIYHNYSHLTDPTFALFLESWKVLNNLAPLQTVWLDSEVTLNQDALGCISRFSLFDIYLPLRIGPPPYS